MRCYNCDHDIKINKFAYNGKQRCPKCGTIYQITFPSGMGLLPVIISFIPALYMVVGLKYQFMVGLAIFVLFYWSIDIIMNLILIYMDKYEINEVNYK